MRARSKHRPSAATVVASLALFASLGGVGYAAATIGSADIRDNSVRSKDVRNRTLRGVDVRPDTLGGKQVKESALGKVPSAAAADSAGSAAHADKAALADKATSADSATTAGHAQTAGSADKLDGIDSSGFMAKKQRAFEVTEGTKMPVPVQNSPALASKLLTNLPAGTYLVTARLEYDNEDAAKAAEQCWLIGPGADDHVDFWAGPEGTPAEHQLITLQNRVVSGSTFSVGVSCTSDGNDSVDSISIIAVALD